MSLPASDDFNRADNSGPPSASWTTPTGAAALKVVSNQCGPAGSSENMAAWTADAFNNDHYSQATINNVGPDYGVAVRMATGAKTCYFVRGTDGQVFELSGGSYTAKGSAFGAFTSGNVMKMTITGTTVEVFKNGSSLGTVSVGSVIGSGSAGLWSWQETANRFDDWSGDNVGGGLTFLARRGLTIQQAVNRAATF